MCSRFQAAALVASPSYPNSIAWSEENLIAVANGHLVTILNPESPLGPRGLIKIPASKPFPIGVIKDEGAISGSLLPTCLARDPECVRAISWSPLRMAANSGCLLAICTVEGRVKLYRPPFCDYSAEWIELVDISDFLYDHLVKTNSMKSGIPSPEFSDKFVGKHQKADNPSNLGPRGERKRKKLKDPGTRVQFNTKEPGLVAEPSSSRQEIDDAEHLGQASPEVLAIEFSSANDKPNEDLSRSQAKSHRNKDEIPMLPLITADQYASHRAVLSSLVIAWSPLLQSSSDGCAENELKSSSFTIFAMGGKSGGISLWTIDMPQSYSIEHANVHPSVRFICLLQAHKSWVTGISWLMLTANSPTIHLLLASGSCDGSVRIWLGSAEDFLQPSEKARCPFILLEEIISPVSASPPISVLSLTAPSSSEDKVLLAIGKGSGSLEVWLDDNSSSGFNKIGSVDAHNHAVTGLAWAYDGSSLYSCSQDNVVRRWRLNGGCISEAPIASSSPGRRGFGYLPNAFHSCFGLAVSPGNVVLAMVRSFDSDQLNRMYESRSLKAAVEFFWIGGQDHNITSEAYPESKTESGPCFPDEEVVCWKSNMLWSLKQYESLSVPLVVWDVIAALLVFKHTAPKIAERFLVEWLSAAYLGTDASIDVETMLPHMSRSISKFTTRQLQLLNVICRRVALSEMKPDEISQGMKEQGMISAEEEGVASWAALVVACENELRERLLGYSCNPAAGTQLKDPSPGIRTYKRRRKNGGGYEAEVKCSYCSASVPFESPEVAFCRGVSTDGSERQRHRLVRCAVSMQICPPTTPLWFCICCHRRALKLAPAPIFVAVGRPTRLESSDIYQAREALAVKPLCPFCGILMQRSQPDFLLSATPV